VRNDLRFPCGVTLCAGWLFLPAAPARAPVVVMASGFAGTRDIALPWFAERFAAAGFAVFVFDYRNFGASGGAPRQLLNPWQQLDDWSAALAFVRKRDDVDATRIALWGSSMGGGHALIAAARDGHVRGVFAQAPLVDTSVEAQTNYFGAIWLVRVILTAWADLVAESLGRGPVMMPVIARAGDFGMIVDDAAHAAFERLVERGSTYRDEIAAHSVWTFDEYDPARLATPLEVPVLLVASRTDRLVPFEVVLRFAAAHPQVRVETFEGDHFDVYSSPARERAADLATAFFTERLAPDVATSP
jgi:pimeloyl-ACP methyl ester carboxylesterase